MDSILIPTPHLTHARNLLSTSNLFEPFIPQSQQNPIYALKWLGELSVLTRSSLLEYENAQQRTLQSPSQSFAPSPLHSPQKTSAQRNASEKTPKKIPKNITDTLILEALMKLRNSGQRLSRRPAFCTTIITATTKA